MSTVTPNLGLFKYDILADANAAFNISTALNNNWDIIDEAISNSGGARNIGEIVASTIPLTDSGLHLLDGTLISGSGIYSDFVDYIASIYDANANYFCSESDWQTSVTTYGVCGKFVYDSTNNTVRLPKYSNQIITKTSAISTSSTVPVVGNGITLGLTDGTNNFGFQTISGNNSGHSMVVSGAYGTNIGSTSSTGYVGANKTFGVTSDGTKSGLIADISSIKNYPLDCYYYIVIATSSKTDIQVDIDAIATDLNGKMDTDLSNMNPSQTAKDTIIGWGLPDYDSGINISVPTQSTPYICQYDCYMQGLSNKSYYIGFYAYINGTEYIIGGGNNTNITQSNTIHLFLPKGTSIYFNTGYVVAHSLYIFPLKGVNNA